MQFIHLSNISFLNLKDTDKKVAQAAALTEKVKTDGEVIKDLKIGMSIVESLRSRQVCPEGSSILSCKFAALKFLSYLITSVHAALKDAKNAMTAKELDAKLEELQQQVSLSSILLSMLCIALTLRRNVIAQEWGF